MKINFLLAAAMLLLLVTGCKKDLDVHPEISNPTSSTLQSSEIEQMLSDLSAREKGFFDKTFASGTNPHVVHNANPRTDADQEYITTVFNTMLMQNAEQPFVDALIDDIGYPFWDKATVLSGEENPEEKAVFIPYAKLQDESISAFLFVFLIPNADPYFVLIDRQNMDEIITNGDPLGFENFGFYLLRYVNFDWTIFGNNNSTYLDLIRRLNEFNLSSPNDGVVKARDLMLLFTDCEEPDLPQPLTTGQAGTRSIICFTYGSGTLLDNILNGIGGGSDINPFDPFSSGFNFNNSNSSSSSSSAGTFDALVDKCYQGDIAGNILTDTEVDFCESLDIISQHTGWEPGALEFEYIEWLFTSPYLAAVSNIAEAHLNEPYFEGLVKSFLELSATSQTSLTWKKFMGAYKALDDIKDQLTQNQYDWLLENIDVFYEINKTQNSNIPNEEKYEAIFNIIVSQNIDPLSIEPYPITTANNPTPWPFTNWDELTPHKLWDIAGDIKADLISEFPDKVQIINDFFPARVLGEAFEESSLESLGIPHYNQSLPGNYTARPDGLTTYPQLINTTTHNQPMIVEIKMTASTSPNYIFDYNSTNQQRNQFLQYLDYLEENTFENQTSASGGLYLILLSDISISETMVTQFATDKNISLFVSRAQIDQDDETKIKVSEPELINWENLNYDSHFFSFLGKEFMKWAMEGILPEKQFNYDKVDFNLQKHAEIFKVSHLGG